MLVVFMMTVLFTNVLAYIWILFVVLWNSVDLTSPTVECSFVKRAVVCSIFANQNLRTIVVGG